MNIKTSTGVYGNKFSESRKRLALRYVSDESFCRGMETRMEIASREAFETTFGQLCSLDAKLVCNSNIIISGRWLHMSGRLRVKGDSLFI